MSLLVERFGDYSFVQALGASFKEVQKNPLAIRGTLKGIIGVVHTIGLVFVLGAPAYALTKGLKIADRTIKIYVGTSRVDTWVNYNYKDVLSFTKDVATTICYAIAVPQILFDMKVLAGTFPKPISIGTDFIDIFVALYELHKLVPKQIEYRTDRPLDRCNKKIEDWNGIIKKIKSNDKVIINSLIEDKKLKVERIDEDILKAAILTFAHDKKVKWEKKKEDLPIRQKSNLYQIIFNVCLAVLSILVAAGGITGLAPFIVCGTVSGLFVAYSGLYSFLYDTFNPEISGVRFNHSPPATK